jgi:hypothetical protein
MSGSKWGDEIRLRLRLDQGPEPSLATNSRRGEAWNPHAPLRDRVHAGGPLRSPSSCGIPWIDDRDAETGEVFDVARHHLEAMFDSRGCDHAVSDAKRTSDLFTLRV